MGRDVARAVPEAMAVYDEGGEASGIDLKELCFDAPRRGTRRDRRCSSPRSSPRRSRSTRRCAAAASSPTSSSGTRSASSRRSASAGALDASRRDRARPRARARDGRGGEGAPRVDGRDPRPRRRGGRSALPQDLERVARELQLPGPARHLRRDAAVDEAASRRRAKARAARSGCASRARSTRRSSRAPRSASARRSSRVKFNDPRSAFMSTVTAKIEDAQRYGELLVDQLTAPVKFTQAARELIGRASRRSWRWGRATC